MIGIASDHGGYELKQKVLESLNDYNIKDYGTYSIDPVDYPDYALKVCNDIKNGSLDKGILICTTGIGMSIAANKVEGIRCAKVDNINEAKMTRLHNDANVIALSASNEHAIEIIKTFLNTDFSNEERHIRKINKIKDIENDN